MEAIFQAGDVIQIPKGCKVKVESGKVIFEKENQEFKDGDILIGDYMPDDASNKVIFIYKGNKSAAGAYLCYILIDLNGVFYTNDSCCSKQGCSIRVATEEEKQQLFDKMEEEGLRWNAKEKRVEKIRWRAKKYGSYYYLDSLLCASPEGEYQSCDSNDRWNCGNYFRTRVQAERAAKALKDALKKFHEEN